MDELNTIIIINDKSKDSSLNRFSLEFIMIVLKPSSKTVASAVNEMKINQPGVNKAPSYVIKYCTLKIDWAIIMSKVESASAKID